MNQSLNINGLSHLLINFNLSRRFNDKNLYECLFLLRFRSG